MSPVSTRARVDELAKLADAIDAQVELLEGGVKKVQHDQRSLRTAILALQHELEAEDLARAPRVGPYTIRTTPTPENDPDD